MRSLASEFSIAKAPPLAAGFPVFQSTLEKAYLAKACPDLSHDRTSKMPR